MASPGYVLPQSPAAPRSAYAAWVAVCVLWGTTYLGIRIALETIPPGLLGGIRFTVAGSLLCAFVRLRGGRLPPLAAWPQQAVIGVLMLGIGNGLVVVAEQWIPSGIAAVGVASAPFWMSGVVAATGGERLTRGMLTGFLLGFSGIVVLIWPEMFQGGAGGALFVAGIVAGQLACLGWSIGSLLSKRTTPHEGGVEAVAVGDVLHDEAKGRDVVRGDQAIVIAEVDFVLPGRDFMVRPSRRATPTRICQSSRASPGVPTARDAACTRPWAFV